MSNVYDIISHERVFKGKIIDVYHDEVILENGQKAIREVVTHNGASAIVPIDKNGNIIFVRQYRHPAKQNVLEIPAGTLEIDEDPMVCAIRELEEETGYKSDKVTFLTKMYSAIGFCTEVLHIYVAIDLYPGKQNLDQDEFVTIEKYTLDEAINLINEGKIIDSKTIASILLYKNNFCNTN